MVTHRISIKNIRIHRLTWGMVGVIETRWGPTYDEEDAHGDEDAIDDGNADDDDTNADDGDDDDNADDGDDDDNVDDDEDADDLAEQLENTHFEGEDDSNDRRKGKAREQYDSDGNNDSGAEDSASVNHDLVYDDPQPQEGPTWHTPFATLILTKYVYRNSERELRRVRGSLAVWNTDRRGP